jgi:hypothetical protein
VLTGWLTNPSFSGHPEMFKIEGIGRQYSNPMAFSYQPCSDLLKITCCPTRRWPVELNNVKNVHAAMVP